MIKDRIKICKTKKELVNEIIDYIKDSVVYLVVLRLEKKWGYIILDFLEEENQNFINEINQIDSLAVILNGYDNCISSKKAVSQSITYFRQQYSECDLLGGFCEN
jgi:hypothetical protein